MWRRLASLFIAAACILAVVLADDEGPPSFGPSWAATVSANMTQVGYDAGLVIVQFSQHCGGDPFAQKQKTVYGDFYTVRRRKKKQEEKITANSRIKERTTVVVRRRVHDSTTLRHAPSSSHSQFRPSPPHDCTSSFSVCHRRCSRAAT